MDREWMVSVENLGKRYGTRPVLRGVNLQVAAGEVVALLGTNGAGKSTLIRILATLTRPDSGRAEVAGHDVRRRSGAVRRRIGVAGQYATVEEVLTVRENLAMTARLAGLPRSAARTAAAREIERFGLASAADYRAGSLSGGTRRRLDLAMSLIGEPSVLLLDEPSVGLDPVSRSGLWQLIRSLAAGGVSVLVTTQYLDEAEALADRVVLLGGGRVLAAGAPRDLRRGIGSSRLTIRFADGGAETRVTDATVADIRGTLERLDAGGRPVQAIEVVPPGFDEVFRALTQQPAASERSEP